MSRVAVVTGGTRGIGAAISKALLAAGNKVAATYHGNDEAAAKFKAETGVNIYKWDVGNYEACVTGLAKVEAELGPVDVLVNNAGITVAGDGPPTKADIDAVRRVFETNFFGALAVTQAMLPLLRKSDAGRIVNVSSGLGSITLNGDPAWEFASVKILGYNASKAALNMLTVQLANELRDTPIKVNSADPGFTATDLNQHRGYQTIEQGAAEAIRLALLPEDGPTGGFFNSNGANPW